MTCPFCNKKTSRFSEHLKNHGYSCIKSAYCAFFLDGQIPLCACGNCQQKVKFISWNKGFALYARGHNRRHQVFDKQLKSTVKNRHKKKASWSKGLTARECDALAKASLNLKNSLSEKRKKIINEKLCSIDLDLAKEKIERYANNFSIIEILQKANRQVDFVLKCHVCHYMQSKNIFAALDNICSNCDPAGARRHIELYNEIKVIDTDTVISCDSIIPPDDVDIFMPRSMTAVDYNRLFFHSEVFKNRLHHAEKSRFASSCGINLLHLFEDEWRDRKEACLNHVMLLARHYNSSTDNIVLRQIDEHGKSQMLSKYHLEGDTESSCNIAAFLEEELVAIVALRKPRHKVYEGSYELIRYCNIGGVEPAKMLTRLVTEAESLLSCPVYTVIDTRLGVESIFFKAGFKKTRKLEPKYWWTDGYQRLSRHKIDESCKNLSLVKIWGGDLFVYEYKKGGNCPL